MTSFEKALLESAKILTVGYTDFKGKIRISNERPGTWGSMIFGSKPEKDILILNPDSFRGLDRKSKISEIRHTVIHESDHSVMFHTLSDMVGGPRKAGKIWDAVYARDGANCAFEQSAELAAAFKPLNPRALCEAILASF